MKMIDEKNLKLIAVVWAVTVALTVAAYNFIILPQVQQKQTLKTQIVEKKQIFEFANNMADEKKRQEIDVNIEKLRKELGKYLVGFENSSNLVFDISQIANEKRVSGFSIRTNDSKKGKPIKASKDISENTVKISFNAGFNQFAAMLNALERHQPVFFINNFAIERSRDSNMGNSVNMDISFFMKG